jgi:hypothetical protein
LKELKGTPGFETEKEFSYFEDLKRDQIIFIFPFTPLITKIDYPDGGFSFNDLLEMSKVKNDDGDDFSHDFSSPYPHPSPYPSLTLSSCSHSQTVSRSDPSFGNNPREDFITLIKLFSTLGLTSDPLHFINWFEKSKVKPRSSTKRVFNNDTKIPYRLLKITTS